MASFSPFSICSFALICSFTPLSHPIFSSFLDSFLCGSLERWPLCLSLLRWPDLTPSCHAVSRQKHPEISRGLIEITKVGFSWQPSSVLEGQFLSFTPLLSSHISSDCVYKRLHEDREVAAMKFNIAAFCTLLFLITCGTFGVWFKHLRLNNSFFCRFISPFDQKENL